MQQIDLSLFTNIFNRLVFYVVSSCIPVIPIKSELLCTNLGKYKQQLSLDCFSIRRQKLMASVRRKQDVYTHAPEMSEKTPLLGGKSGPVFTPKPTGTPPPPPVHPSANPSLSTALVKTFGGVYLVSLGFKFISDVLQFVSPVLLG